VRMVDFGPGVERSVRAVARFGRDAHHASGRRVQRATAYKWTNITGNGTLPGRIMWVLLDCKPVYGADGEMIESNLGSLKKEHLGRGHICTRREP
jgi:hypothetical protein